MKIVSGILPEDTPRYKCEKCSTIYDLELEAIQCEHAVFVPDHQGIIEGDIIQFWIGQRESYLGIVLGKDIVKMRVYKESGEYVSTGPKSLKFHTDGYYVLILSDKEDISTSTHHGYIETVEPFVYDDVIFPSVLDKLWIARSMWLRGLFDDFKFKER